MPRGRPKKIVVEQTEEEKSVQWIIADVMHDYCYIPGCTTRLHLDEASTVIEVLKRNNFTIQEMN